NRAVESTLRAAGYSSPLLGGDLGVGNPLPGGDKGVGSPHKRVSNYHRKILPYNPSLKAKAKELRKNMTLSEVLLWNELKQKQLKGFDFDRQRPIDEYIVDFYCKDLMLAIEVDGDSHDSKEAQRYDKARQERLESMGVRFLRFDDHDVKKDIGWVLEEIEEWIELHKDDLVGREPTPSQEGSRPTPNPSQEGNEFGASTEGNSNEWKAQESPESYGVPGVKSQPIGDKKGGVVWHTQGSGKSLSMVFYTGKIVLALDNPTVLVITDRNDLDDQLFDTFAASTQLLRQEPKQVENRQHLKELLKVASGGVIFTTIQKFQPDEGNVYEELSSRKNIVVIADEAHRTQYGFKAKNVDEKDDKGNVVGKKTVYGFAKYLRDALPNATYLGFTGTPIESTDVNTPAVFGNYIDVYDIAQAVEDGATVRIFYESRLAKVALSEEGRKLVDELDSELEEEDLTETQKAKAKWTQLEALIGSENRLKNIAEDIITHFEQRQEVFAGKGM
ncbi:MAG: DUF559 domain-containing protein, partial [Cyclobacteriaceae bacterium]